MINSINSAISLSALEDISGEDGSTSRPPPWYIHVLSTVPSQLSHLTIVVNWNGSPDANASFSMYWRHLDSALRTSTSLSELQELEVKVWVDSWWQDIKDTYWNALQSQIQESFPSLKAGTTLIVTRPRPRVFSDVPENEASHAYYLAVVRQLNLSERTGDVHYTGMLLAI